MTHRVEIPKVVLRNILKPMESTQKEAASYHGFLLGSHGQQTRGIWLGIS